MERIKKALLEARKQRDKKLVSTNRIDEKFESSLQSKVNGHDYYDESELNKSTIQAISPCEKNLEKKKILFADSPIQMQRAYKMLRTRFLQRLKQNNWNTIAVISPSSNDGKTLTAINLCVSISHDLNHTSLLVDLDLLKPNLSNHFNFKPEVSINKCLHNDIPFEKCLVRVDQNFFIAPASQVAGRSSEILASHAAIKLSRDIKHKFRNLITLYDLPPILACDDALSFLPNVDAVLLVLREGKTKRRDVKAMMEMLADKPIAGVVLNDSKCEISDHYHY